MRRPSNLNELEQFCQEEWAKIPGERCEKLVDSIRNRLQAVSRQRTVPPSIKCWGVLTFAQHLLNQIAYYSENKTSSDELMYTNNGFYL